MKSALLSATLICALAAAPGAHAVVAGEIDTFSAGLESWFAGGGPMGAAPVGSPVRVASGGPAGAGDSFMQLSADGSPRVGGRLVGMNATQWAGNYTAAGIGAIAMDLRNFGDTDLTIRLYLEDPIPGPPLNEAVTTSSVLLRAGSGWTHALFAIEPGSLTMLQGNAATLLSNTTVLRIFSGAAADFPPATIVGQLGIDNIEAIAAIPEPETIALLAAGLGLLALRSRRRPARD